MSKEHEEVSYATYKGMGTIAMFMGIPLMFFLICMTGAVVSGFIGLVTLGPLGLLGPLIFGACGFAMRIACETDNKQMEKIRWNFKAWRLRLKKTATVITVSSTTPGAKYEHFYRYVKKVHRSK